MYHVAPPFFADHIGHNISIFSSVMISTSSKSRPADNVSEKRW